MPISSADLKGKLTSNLVKGSNIAVTGETGNGIEKIEKTSTEGLVDTYTITYTNKTTSTFTVTNGPTGPQGPQGEKGPTGPSYTAGTGISIENNIISNTQNNAVWGNISGSLANQSDLSTELNNIKNKLNNIQESIIKNNGTSANYSLHDYCECLAFGTYDTKPFFWTFIFRNNIADFFTISSSGTIPTDWTASTNLLKIPSKKYTQFTIIFQSL